MPGNVEQCALSECVTVLLADDDACIRRCLKYAVECDCKLSVKWEADNGIQAVALAQQQHPDVVLIDVQMARMNGVEATRCIRSRNPNVKIVVMGLYESDREQALAAGANAFLIKDSGCDAFRKTIHSLLIEESSDTEEI